MSFFQNLFNEYIGIWDLSKQTGKDLPLSFNIKSRKANLDLFISASEGSYDLSGGSNLYINIAFDPELKNYVQFVVDIAGNNVSATTALEIADILNNDSNFSTWFVAGVDKNKIYFKQTKKRENFRTYISNEGAEKVLRFNKLLHINDIPSYFEKDVIENNNEKHLIKLGKKITSIESGSPTIITSESHGLSTNDIVYISATNCTPKVVGQYTITRISDDTFSIVAVTTADGDCGEWFNEYEKVMIEDAGLNYSDLKKDWEHLNGRTNIFEFNIYSYDGSNRVISKITYPAGSEAGWLGTKTIYTYDGVSTNTETEVIIPYIIQESDLLNP